MNDVRKVSFWAHLVKYLKKSYVEVFLFPIIHEYLFFIKMKENWILWVLLRCPVFGQCHPQITCFVIPLLYCRDLTSYNPHRTVAIHYRIVTIVQSRFTIVLSPSYSRDSPSYCHHRIAAIYHRTVFFAKNATTMSSFGFCQRFFNKNNCRVHSLSYCHHRTVAILYRIVTIVLSCFTIVISRFTIVLSCFTIVLSPRYCCDSPSYCHHRTVVFYHRTVVLHHRIVIIVSSYCRATPSYCRALPSYCHHRTVMLCSYALATKYCMHVLLLISTYQTFIWTR